MTHALPPLPDLLLEPMIRTALLEDLGAAGDITSRLVIPAGTTSQARLRARKAGIVSGLGIAALTFRLLDPGLEIRAVRADGDRVAPGDTLLEVAGSAAAILSAERVALNFAGRLSGIATLTGEYAARIAGTRARISCTRKTTPGLRMAEKAAVLHGGGVNHRFSLSDAVLIKDNHVAAGGGIAAVLEAVKARASYMLKVEIEVDRLDQLAEVLETGGADVVLLDNMDVPTLREAVALAAGRVLLEASGNVGLDRVAEVAATGVDFISAGALTHSAPVLDLGLDF